MKTRTVLKVIIGGCLVLSSVSTVAGDLECYGKTSTTSHFECLSTGNCVWWAAFKRPDLAAAITGSGWNGGQWYDQFKKRGFSVGQEPREGAIVEFSGHVAYVEKVYGDRSFYVSEMDAFGSEGFVPGVNYATYHPIGDGKYLRNNGKKPWILKGFIYKESRSYSLTIYHAGDVGWYPMVDMCQDADSWYRLSQEDGKTIAAPADKSVCDGVAPMCYAQ